MTIAINISAALLIACAGMAHCAEPAYPTRPVRLLVGFPPGGSTDALARIITPRLGTAMGQNWIVDNRGGAGGNLASETAARATPDGHTVFLALSTQLTASPSLYKLPFSVEQDLQPITVLATHEHIVLVHPNVPVRTLKELITLAQQKPGALNYASSGVGGSLHLAAELLKRRAGFEITHIPYKGAGPAIAGVLAGEVPVLIGAVPSTLAFFTSGRLRALATTGAKRHKVTAELPTVAELGYPGFENIAWFGLFVPTGTPKSIVDRIRGESLKGLEHPDVQSTMGRLGLDRETSTPAELAARLKAEPAQLATVIRVAGIRGE
ncbi:MAG: tripartite tricarboxylate transporter substrate binding protein [Proteobacteria bacterium]|nr:tripartite tricarboxylate transporter substrate binding protein [Pseudomonadota bacterium]